MTGAANVSDLLHFGPKSGMAGLRPVALAIAVGIATAALAEPLSAEMAREQLALSGSHGDQQFVAGGRVRVQAELSDDLFAAGGQVAIESTAAEDIIAAGGLLRLESINANDVIAAGGQVTFDGNIGDDVVLAGGTLRLGSDTVIGGDAWLAGADLDIAGQIGGKLSVVAGTVRLDGRVDSDVDVIGESIIITDQARLGGDLVYRSSAAADIAAGAVIAGDVRWIEVERDHFGGQRWRWVMIGIAAWLGGLLAVCLAGAFVQATLPELMRDVRVAVHAKPWRSLALGFAILVATPVLIGLLMATGLGIPLALLLLASYGAVMGVALVAAAYWLGALLLRWLGRASADDTTWRRILATAFGLLILAIALFVPFIGFLMALIGVAMGLGALSAQLWASLRSGAASR